MSDLLSKYRLVCNDGAGGPPTYYPFGSLGITACTVTTMAGGEDSATITVNADIAAEVTPFTPWARHDIYAPGVAQPVFSGWLVRPAVQGSAGRQQQTFVLDGPMALLAGIPFQQTWTFLTNPESGDEESTILQALSRTILNAGSTQVGPQIQEIFQWFQSELPAMAALGDTSSIPAVKPPEDEQSDRSCADCLRRQLRAVPAVTAYWQYGATPTLAFALAGDGASYDLTVDAADGTVENLSSVARHDILLRELTVNYVGEVATEPDPENPDALEGIALTLAPDTSTANNGSLRKVVYTCRLRGLSDLYAAESVPNGLAAALHEPFKTLTHTLEWAKVALDVDWTVRPGMAVRALNAGGSLADSRPVLQRITRNLATGTTTCQAGPPAHLDMDDLIGLHRQLLSRTRNAARNDGHGGPGEQSFGMKDKDKGSDGGTGNANNVGTDCTVDLKGNSVYANRLVTPCIAGTSGATHGLDLSHADIFGDGAAVPASALPVKFREVKACDDEGNPGFVMIVASGFYTKSN